MAGLVSVEAVIVNEENVLGVRLPVLGQISFSMTEYSMVAKPFWVDLPPEGKMPCRFIRHRHIAHGTLHPLFFGRSVFSLR